MIKYTKFNSMNTGIKFLMCIGIFRAELQVQVYMRKKNCFHRYDFTIEFWPL